MSYPPLLRYAADRENVHSAGQWSPWWPPELRERLEWTPERGTCTCYLGDGCEDHDGATEPITVDIESGKPNPGDQLDRIYNAARITWPGEPRRAVDAAQLARVMGRYFRWEHRGPRDLPPHEALLAEILNRAANGDLHPTCPTNGDLARFTLDALAAAGFVVVDVSTIGEAA